MTNISATHRHTPLLTWIVTTDFVPRTWCCFQRASRKSRGQKWGHMKGVSVYVCVGERGGGGCSPSRGVPCLHVSAITLFLRVTDTHVGTYQPKLLQLMAVPLRCPWCCEQAWVTRNGLGSVSPVTQGRNLKRGEKWCKATPPLAAHR